MINRFRASTLSAVLSVISLLGLLILVSVTNPVDKISHVMVFFLIFLIFLISVGNLLMHRIRGEVSPKNRYRVFIVSIFLVVLIMFRSAQSLGWLEAAVLLSVMSGLLFYGGRRT